MPRRIAYQALGPNEKVSMTDNNDDPDLLPPPPSTSALPPTDGHAQPGALRSETWLTLHTIHAANLFFGRRGDEEENRAPIPGLTRFASRVASITVGARLDDPYADWWLLKIEAALEKATAVMDENFAIVRDRMAASATVEANPALSTQPLRVPLEFQATYAHRGALLLARYDDLVRHVLTAKHIGRIDRWEAAKLLGADTPAGATVGAPDTLIGNENLGRDEWRMVGGAGRAVRGAFQSAMGYTYKAVRREDVRLQTAAWGEVQKLMGDVPEDVVAGTRRARFAPEIADRPSGDYRTRRRRRSDAT